MYSTGSTNIKKEKKKKRRNKTHFRVGKNTHTHTHTHTHTRAAQLKEPGMTKTGRNFQREETKIFET